jgi:hypothetical protein
MEEIRLANSAAQAVIRPDIGRIISFGRPGGSNRLWVAEDPDAFGTQMPLYGGLKIMVTPEVLWSQVRKTARSDPATDGGPWEVLEQSTRHVRMQIFSPDLGVTVTWTIRLHEKQPELQIDYDMKRTEENPFPVHLWSITQVPLEGDLFMSCLPHTQAPYRNCIWAPRLDDAVELLPDRQALRFSGLPVNEPLKVGTFGRWIAHLQKNEVFMICAQRVQRRAYAEGSNLQAFSWAGHFPFYEMEVTSPLYDLCLGESFQTLETWKLFDVYQDFLEKRKWGELSMASVNPYTTGG